jgi:uncharacterized repeat protein (TIGR01451 family)
MKSSIRSIPKDCVWPLLLCIAFVANLHAETFSAGVLHTRQVGPYVAAQANPAPVGGWQASDDRLLNTSINGQGGWQSIDSPTRIDEEITNGIAHSGGHSWRVSNWFHSGYVNEILSPQFGSVGETASTNHDGAGATTQSALSNHVVYDFWFRSAAPDDAHADPGSAVSTTISDAPGNRMTYLGMFDEAAGPGGPSGNGCPTNNGCFHVDAVEVVSGNDAGADGDASFVDHYSPALTRGVWYRAHIDATFVDGPGAVTTDPLLCPAATVCHAGNDQIHYQIFDVSGNVVFDTGNLGSWEAAYFDGRYGNTPGTIVASDYAGFRISGNADTGGQQPFGTNSVTNRPHGIYIDDLSVVPAAGSSIKTSFDFDRYVATSGTDSGTCNVQASPCKTITYAIAQANAYDTIHVAAGRYAENSGAGQNLVINKAVAIEGAQAGIDARTRNVGDLAETILVPAVIDTSLTLDSLNSSAVVTIAADGVSLDGLIVDGDNPSLNSSVGGNPLNLNGSNPDAAAGMFASGSGITVQNVVLRNLPGAGVFAYMDSDVGGDNQIQLNRFTNITNPSTWGLGIYAGHNFYAQISDNLMDQVRVGMQIENNSSANTGAQAPAVLRNEIHATRTGIFHNLFYGSASTYTYSDNTVIAALNAAQIGQWNGMQIESMGGTQTVVINNNYIDGSALASTRIRVGYLLNNWTSSLSATTAINGGSVSNVDAGVLATDATNYTGPVNGALVQNVAFSNITLGAIYVEDTNEVAGSPVISIGTGNTFAGVNYKLALSGAAASASFSGSSGIDTVLVRAAKNYLFGKLNSGPCSAAQCTVSNTIINSGIAAVTPGGTVFIEQGTFDQMPTLGAGKNGVRLTSADSANPAVLTRLSGGPNQPVLLVNGVKNIVIDHLHFSVDKKHAAEGILANGTIDGLNIHDNQIVQTASSTSGTASYRYTNGISINIDPGHNSLGLSQTDGQNATISNNTISASTVPNATRFRAGIAMDRGIGTITGNTTVGLNHDAIVRFANTVVGGPTAVLISGNTFNGGGLEFDAPNIGVAPITISNNVITAAPGSPLLGLTQQQFEADFSVLRLIDNSQNVPVTVSNNLLLGYAKGYRGATVQNFPLATFTGNTFTPLAGATDFVSLVVSNKNINQNTPPQAPYPMSITVLRNNFNASGVNGAGRAVEFIDDNDANGTAAFGALLFGSSQATDANLFDPAHQFYFNLVNQQCDTNLNVVGTWPGGVAPVCTFLDYNDVNAPGGIANTQVRPFRVNVEAANNQFGGVVPAAMDVTQRAALFARTYDVNDNAALGLVNYGLGAGVVLKLNGPLTNVQASVPTVFTGEVANAGPTLTENSVVHLAISSDRAGGIQAADITAEYYDASSSSYQPLPLTLSGGVLVVDYGPAGGFAIAQGYDVTTPFRYTFNYANGVSGSNYTAAGSVVGVGTHTVYAVDSHSTNVVQSASRIALTLAGPLTATVATPITGYNARILNAGGATTENSLVHFVISRSGGIGASDLLVQYFDGSAYQSIPLVLCNGNTQLCGTFGPPTGFPIGVGYDATTPLQLSFAKSGAFQVIATVDGVSSTNYATASLLVNVNPGPATSIAAFGSTSFSGIAGAALATSPAVIATDAGGNPVAGVSVNFATGSNSGSVTGAAQITNASGIAGVSAWILSADPNASDTLSASAAGLTGSPVNFTATGAAQYDLAVAITPSRNYVQYGHTLNYVVVLNNSGPSNASGISVQDSLASALNIGSTSTFCVGSSGAVCASSSGNLSDSNVSVPVGGSVTYVVSTTVLNSPGLLSDQIADTVTITGAHDSNPANNTATAAAVQIVIFRNGLEIGGDGALNTAAEFTEAGSLDDVGSLSLNLPQISSASAMPATWFKAIDVSGRETFRAEIVQLGGTLQLRVISIAANGEESRSAWSDLATSVTHLALALSRGKSTQPIQAMLVGGMTELAMPLPTWAKLPLALFVRQ